MTSWLLPPGYTLHSTSSRQGVLGGWRADAWVEVVGHRGVQRCCRTAHVVDRWRTPRNRRLAHLKAEQLVLDEVSRREYARLNGVAS